MPNDTPKQRCRCRYTRIGRPWRCPREALPDSKDGFCICHERRDDKDEKLFREEVDKVLKGEKADAYDFEGFYFPFEVDFSRFEFKKNTYFIEAIFKKSVNFFGAQFSGKKTDFSKAQFSGHVTYFREAVFSGKKTDFSKAQFSGDQTYFRGGVFSGDGTYFSEAQFSGKETDFCMAQFSGKEISFFEAQFSGEKTDFSLAQFSGKVTDFLLAQFSGKVTDFRGAQFSGEKTDFSKAQFSGDVTYFSGAQFSGKVTHFSLAQFLGEKTDFGRAQFSGDVTYFSLAQFSGKETDFSKAQFSGKETLFNGAQFSGEWTNLRQSTFAGKGIHFSGAQFSAENTNFSGAKFLGEWTNFSEARFLGMNTYFCGTQFRAEETHFLVAQFLGSLTNFFMARFSGEKADFSELKISNLVDFSKTSFQSKETKLYYLETEKNARLIFKETIIEESNKYNLTKLDLSKCFFQETNLEYCDLSLAPMNWKTKLLNESLSKQEYTQVLGLDEGSKIDKPERFSQAAESYRMLKVNFSKRQDYRRAAMCHCREWDCNRKALGWWPAINIPNHILTLVLKFSSGYGERLKNVFWFTVFLFILFSLILSLAPLIPTGVAPPTEDEISAWQQLSYWSRLTPALKYTFFHLLPLWRLSDLRAATDFGNIMSGLMTIAGAFMIGLFIYVFRRRLMR